MIFLKLYTVLFFAFLLAPILVVVAVSFTSAQYISFPLPGLSLRWFERIYEYRPFLDSLVVSLKLAAVSACVATVLGVPAAIALARGTSRRATAVATFLIAPISTPQIVLGFGMLYYFSQLGLGISFLSLVLAHSVVCIPYTMRSVLGVYRAVPRQLEEAATMLGAGPWRTLTRVTLPMLLPGIGVGALFCALISLDNLPVSYFFGSPSTNTLPVVMLSYLENQFDPSIAAMSTVQMLIALVALLAIERLNGLDRLGVGGKAGDG